MLQHVLFRAVILSDFGNARQQKVQAQQNSSGDAKDRL